MAQKHIKTRFAPSPTGFLHVGGLRTALFAYLFAKKHGGTFALRIEDTDRNRFVEGAVENIIDALHWAGILIDEGVDKDEHGRIVQKGECGPYVQSERLVMYKKFVQELIASGHAYYAFDTPEQLEHMRREQETMKLPTAYDRDKMNNQFTLGEEETQKRLAAGDPYVIRMCVPKEGETQFDDAIRGRVTIQNNQVDDQILIKADGYPTYHLAVVVDDHTMGITHVIRGEEWLPSTPKHVLLYKAFGWEAPVFAHLPLLVNEQKQKLSKRHGDVSVEDFKEQGYLAEALVNFIAFLGWNPGDDREIFSLSELQEAFALEQVSKSAAVFNREKLNWYNKQYMMQLPLEEVTQRAIPFFVRNAVLSSEELTQSEALVRLRRAIALERSRVNTLAELPGALGFIYAKGLFYESDLLIWKKSTREATAAIVHDLLQFLTERTGEWTTEALEADVRAWGEKSGYGTGDLLWPMRVALSGQKNSPGPFEIAAVLGREESLSRIARAAELIT